MLKRIFQSQTPLFFLLSVLFGLGALSACNLVTQQEYQQMLDQTSTAQANNRPTVTIISPPNGAEFTLGQVINVSVNAVDSIGITRVTLSVDGQTVDSVQSESPTGSTVMNALFDYTPPQAGTVTLIVNAFRGSVVSDPAIVQVNVRQTQAQVTATLPPQPGVPTINPNDPTCRALVNVGLNVRSGPGTNFPVVTTLAAGSVVPIIGRTPTNDWWQIRVSSFTTGWISAQFTTVYGICTNVPIVSSPPTPTTSAPTATFTPIPPTSTLTLTPVPPTLTPTPGLPDLVVTSIIGPTALTLGPGDTPVTASYSITVSNTGQSAAGQFNTTIQVTPGGPPTSIGVVANLYPGESIVWNANLTFDTAGTYAILVVADANNQVTEVSEVNNTGSTQVTVTSAP
jgi:uncharacterized protein YgiM (DUF1202 family)